MIYLFDRQKKLQKIIPKKHLLSAIQTVELNGLYQLSVEVPLFYETKEGTQYNHKKNIERAWFAGHYDRQKRFQLYKIHARKVKADNKRILIFDGVHIFFDEAKAMGNIHDRRLRDTDVKAPADAAFNSIGWYIKDYDVTDRADITFYRDSVANARSLIIEKFGVEFDYGLTFDGRKIISKDLYIKKRLGRWTGKRFTYGSNLLSLSQEEDESEVYTAAVGRGKGEEIGEGHGPRIEFGDIEWSKDGITKPVGQNWIEIPSATAEYGYYENGELKPRIAAEVIFENTENKKLIADSTYYWLLENCVPKAVWKTDVAKSGIHDLGDSGGVIYKKADIVKIARVHKMENNLLNDALSKIMLGDYQHFKTDKRQQSIRAQIKRNHADNQSVITQMKNDFDARFDAQTTAINNAYQQAVIDANANIQASEARMNVILSEQKATIEQDINQAEENAINKAAQNTEQQTQEVMGSLNDFKGVHQQLYDDVTTDIMNIDDFLGDISNITLDERLQEMNLDFEDRIRNININTANMLQGSRFDEPAKINTSIGGAEILTTSDINRIRIRDDTGYVSRFSFEETVKLEANTDYFVTIEYRTFTVPEIDYFAIETPTGYVRLYSPDTGKEGFSNLVTDGVWNQATIRLNEPVMLQGKLHIGTRPGGDNNGAWIDVRQPYMTNTSNRRWLPHPNDATQSIEQISRRITELEDGREELITRSEYNFDTGQVDQTIREIEETVDTSKNLIVDIQNYDVIKNGSEVMQTVDGFNQKVWMGDVANIGANLLPQSSGAWEDGGLWIGNGGESPNASNIRMVENRTVKSSTDYTISDYSTYVSAIEYIDIHEYTEMGTHMGYHRISRGGEKTFTTHWNTTNVRVSLLAMDGFSVGTHFIEHLDGRIKVKLEEGSESTAMVNAISHLQQMADKISLKVQELSSSDGEDILTQSDISVQADRVLIGSQSIGASTLASIISVSPTAVDIITDEMNLTGNLNVLGQIETISLNAIDANFARVQTAVLTADVIDNLMIRTNAVRADHIFVDSQLVNNLWSHFIWAEKVTTASIDAIYGDIRSLNSEIFTSNIIKSNWLDVDTALFNRFTSSEAFIDRLTVKAANIRDLDAIEINTYQLNMTSILNEAGKIEGGYRIRGHDGRLVINNGILQNSFDIGFIQPHFMGVDVDTSANYFRTKNTFYSTAAAFSYKRGGRYLVVEGYCEIRRNTAGASANTVGAIRLLEYSGTANRSTFVMIGSRNENNNNNQYFKLELDLGVPQYEQRNFYVQFYVANAESDALFRINQAYQYG